MVSLDANPDGNIDKSVKPEIEKAFNKAFSWTAGRLSNQLMEFLTHIHAVKQLLDKLSQIIHH